MLSKLMEARRQVMVWVVAAIYLPIVGFGQLGLVLDTYTYTYTYTHTYTHTYINTYSCIYTYILTSTRRGAAPRKK